ncbi:UNVERIFIED_ORG: hypothetical protein BDK47_10812 [Anoxybacillus amylolyticus]
MEYRSEARICRESSLTRLFLDNMIICPGRRPAGRLSGLTYHTSSHQVHVVYQRGIYTIIWTLPKSAPRIRDEPIFLIRLTFFHHVVLHGLLQPLSLFLCERRRHPVEHFGISPHLLHTFKLSKRLRHIGTNKRQSYTVRFMFSPLDDPQECLATALFFGSGEPILDL